MISALTWLKCSRYNSVIGDEKALFEKMNHMLDHIEDYDRNQIRQYALDHFSNEVIGNSLYKVYSESAKK